jgi:hypothetical protein
VFSSALSWIAWTCFHMQWRGWFALEAAPFVLAP